MHATRITEIMYGIAWLRVSVDDGVEMLRWCCGHAAVALRWCGSRAEDAELCGDLGLPSQLELQSIESARG